MRAGRGLKSSVCRHPEKCNKCTKIRSVVVSGVVTKQKRLAVLKAAEAGVQRSRASCYTVELVGEGFRTHPDRHENNEEHPICFESSKKARPKSFYRRLTVGSLGNRSRQDEGRGAWAVKQRFVTKNPEDLSARCFSPNIPALRRR